MLISACGTHFAADDRGPGVLSASGETVFFEVERCSSGSGVNAGVAVPDSLYARIDGERTVLLSGRSPAGCTSAECLGSQQGTPMFWSASDDGSRVFFTDRQQLTNDASEEGNLYEYDFERPAGHNLVDVSAGDTSGGGPRVQGVLECVRGWVACVFRCPGRVDRDAEQRTARPLVRALTTCICSSSTRAIPKARSRLSPPSRKAIRMSGTDESANVTPDGRFLVFMCHAQLTAGAGNVNGAAQIVSV